MKMFLVSNNDDTILGLFDKKSKAKDLVKLGKKRWNETWGVQPIKVNHVELWVLNGTPSSFNKRVK